GGNRTAARFRDGRPAAGHRPPRPRRRPGGADGRRPRDGREGAGAGVPLTLLEGGAAPVVAVGGLLAVPVLSSTGGGPVFLTALTVWGAVLGLSWAVGNRTGRVRRPEPRPPAAAPEERRVTADMLDAPAREPLRRTQEE